MLNYCLAEQKKKAELFTSWAYHLPSFLQAVCFILFRPLSKSTYRRINRVVAELLWLELVWIIDWWAGVKVSINPLCVSFYYGFEMNKSFSF